MTDLKDILAQDPDLQDIVQEGAPRTRHEAVVGFTSAFMASLRNSLTYSPGHSRFQAAIALTETMANHAFSFEPKITFVCLEKEILLEGRPMGSKGVQFQKMGEFLDSIGVGFLEFIPGLVAEEFQTFILGLSGLDEAGNPSEGRVARTTRHIRFGRLKVERSTSLRLPHSVVNNLISSGAVSEDLIQDLRNSARDPESEDFVPLDPDLVNRAREIIRTVASSSVRDKVSTRDTVMNFVHYFIKYSPFFEILHHLKNHDEITFKHSVNVALLCAAQARFLELPTEVCRDLFLAGLFHDIGKVTIPVAILNKSTPLTVPEKVRMAAHSEEGARILAMHPQIPRAVVVAAYEHHLHNDGLRGYPRHHRAEKPHPISQMVALADVYDSLRTTKPYREPYSIQQAMGLFTERVGQMFDPFLAANFARVLQVSE